MLRDGNDEAKAFARTVLELRTLVQPATAARLVRTYNDWVEAEFPDTVTAEGLRKLEADAEGK